MTREIIATFEVDDDEAINLDMGTVDFFESVVNIVSSKGVKLLKARILDDDDAEDADLISAAEKIF